MVCGPPHHDITWSLIINADSQAPPQSYSIKTSFFLTRPPRDSYAHLSCRRTSLRQNISPSSNIPLRVNNPKTSSIFNKLQLSYKMAPLERAPDLDSKELGSNLGLPHICCVTLGSYIASLSLCFLICNWVVMGPPYPWAMLKVR